MTDPIAPPPVYPYGLGGIPSAPDSRDWPIDLLYAALPGAPVDASAMPSYLVPGKLPPVLNQMSSPECVAYSQSTLKAYEDLKDQGAFNFDENTFFHEIGGNAGGAFVRAGLERMLKYGYPVVGNTSPANLHRIAAYYAVPGTEAALMAAIANFGPVTVLLEWQEEWFHPVAGVLPAGRVYAGNHEIDIIGWDARGAELQNTWGTAYGIGGRVFLSWPQLTAHLIEAWKAVDVIETPPPTATYHVHIAPFAKIWVATLRGSCIASWSTSTWGPASSGAPCAAPETRKGCSSGQATVVYVTAGKFARQRVRVSGGVTVARI